MSERKLATIQQIKDIKSIDGADFIELVYIKGWQCIAKKGEFQKGDLCVYFEIDSFLPIKPEFEFLRKSSYKRMADGSEGFRLRTIKMKGVVSQGLALPIDVLPNDVISSTSYDNLIGTDVTDVLKIKKYEAPIPANLAGKVKGQFPSFIKKTDAERIQNCEFVLDKYSDELFCASEKLDGTSITIFRKNGKFGVCSRNLELIETDDNTYWKVVREMEIEEKLKELNLDNIALQGEMIGEGIQKNLYKLKGQTIRFFDVFDINNYTYYSVGDFKDLINKLKLETVPFVELNFKLPNNIDTVLKMADGMSKLNSKQNREGLVFKSMREISDPSLGRTMFKAISNKFLLKTGN